MPRPARRQRSLADGREIIYFDDTEPYLSGAQTRELVDKRDLGRGRPGRPDAPRPAERRVDRDGDAPAGPHLSCRRPTSARCCPTGRGTEPSEVPADDYDVVVFENRFPSYSTRSGDEAGRRRRRPTASGPTRRRPGGARSSASPATTTRPSPTSTPTGCAR